MKKKIVAVLLWSSLACVLSLPVRGQDPMGVDSQLYWDQATGELDVWASSPC